MQEEKLEIFAQPLPLSENDVRQIDMNNPSEYSFAFEVGLKPDFTLPELSKQNATRYKVTITDDMIEEEVNRLRLRHGKMTDPETTTGDDNVLNVTFIESDADGNEMESGVRRTILSSLNILRRASAAICSTKRRTILWCFS